MRGGITHTEPEDRLRRTGERFAHARVVLIGDDVPADGDELGKAAEGMLDVVKVFEKVEMIGFDIQNHRDGGEEAQKRIAVFAALGDDRVALAHAVTAVQKLQRAADHHGRPVAVQRIDLLDDLRSEI